MTKQKTLIQFFLLFLCTRLKPGELFYQTPAEIGCGGSALVFRQTSLQAQKRRRQDLVGVLFGAGGG